MPAGDAVMPLRDHFRHPTTTFASWDELRGGWPMVIVQQLRKQLPAGYVAAPRVHAGAQVEIDVATFERDSDSSAVPESERDGGVATAVWAPAEPSVAVETALPDDDEYEVRIYDAERGRTLVAAIEIVSPANKDRPEHRQAFASKCAGLLQERVSVVIVDIVTTRTHNLYAELLELIGQSDPELDDEATSLYAASCRVIKRNNNWILETWRQTLSLGRALPAMPLWLTDDLALPLELEESYEQSCAILNLP
jgi:hypothetical protein